MGSIGISCRPRLIAVRNSSVFVRSLDTSEHSCDSSELQTAYHKLCNCLINHNVPVAPIDQSIHFAPPPQRKCRPSSRLRV